jgi:hypothetical protein
LVRGHDTVTPNLIEGGHHDSQGFGRAPFAFSKPFYGQTIGGITGEVKSSQTFESDDRSRSKEIGTLLYRFRIPGFPVRRGERILLFYRCLGQPDPRTADGTGIGLGMKAAVRGIVIFRLTGRAHLERGHGGEGPVIRNVFDNGEPRATVRAVDEGIAIPPIPWVK